MNFAFAFRVFCVVFWHAVNRFPHSLTHLPGLIRQAWGARAHTCRVQRLLDSPWARLGDRTQKGRSSAMFLCTFIDGWIPRQRRYLHPLHLQKCHERFVIFFLDRHVFGRIDEQKQKHSNTNNFSIDHLVPCRSFANVQDDLLP